MFLGKESEEKTIGLIIDIETTGLNEGDKIIKFAGVLFVFNKVTGDLIEIIDQYQGKKVPWIKPGARENEAGEEAFEGGTFDQEKIEEMINKTEVIISHNNQLVKRFVGKIFPQANEKEWFETMEGFPWTSDGFPSKPLDEISPTLVFAEKGYSPIIEALKGVYAKVSSKVQVWSEELKMQDFFRDLLGKMSSGEKERPQKKNGPSFQKRKGIEFKGTINSNPIRKYEILGPSSKDYNQKVYKARIFTQPQQEFKKRKKTSIKKKLNKKVNARTTMFVAGLGLFLIILLVIFILATSRTEEPDMAGITEERPARREEVHLSREEESEFIKKEMLIGWPQAVVNFREGPDTNYDIKRQLNPENSFFVVGEQENWYYAVLLSPNLEEKGWVHKDFVDVLAFYPEEEKIKIIHIGPGAETRDLLHLGMEQEKVFEILGEPEMTGDRIWYYRGAPVFFNQDKEVIGWENRNQGLNVNFQTRGLSSIEIKEKFNREFSTWIERNQ